MSRILRRVAGVASCAALLLTANGASANGRYPSSTQIVFSNDAADPDLVVVRATYGLLISRDRGATWRWLCEGSLGVPSVSIEDPSICLTANDSLVVGLVEGLEASQDTSRDLGCTFACVEGPLAGQPIVDLALSPDAPHTVVALSSAYVFDDAGKATSLDTRIWQTTDDGAHWAQLGPAFDPTVSVTTLDVAPSDPTRLYVSGTRGFGAARTASLFVSTDAGASWTERPLPFDPATEVSVFIGGVDPDVADRVYVRSSGVSRLFVTSDAGRSFAIPLTLTGQMLGFAVAPDGSAVYAGSVEDGLFVGTVGGSADAGVAALAFRKVSSIHVECLAVRGSELWACSDAASGFSVGVSDTAGATFTPRLQLGGVIGPIACAANAANAQGPFACEADANASQCGGAAFEAVCATLGGCDAGAAGDDGGADDGPDATVNGSPTTVSAIEPPHFGSCGCVTAVGSGSIGLRGSGSFGAVSALTLLVARRRKARRRRRSDDS